MKICNLCKGFFIIPLVFFCWALVSIEAFADGYVYRSLKDGWPIIIEPKAGLLGMGDLASEAYFCDGDAKYYCFDQIGISFSVPKDLSAGEMSWRLNKQEFSMSELREINIFGEKIRGVDIETHIDGVSSNYFYSKEFGLIWIAFFDDTGMHNIYFITDKQGYGWEPIQAE